MLKDILLFTRDLIRSNGAARNTFYWDDAPKEDLDRLVRRLSNPNDAERQLINQILQERAPESLLDVACGPATELESCRDAGLKFSYVGLDRSAKMIEIAQKRFPEAKFIRGSAEQLPFPDGSFQAVLLKHVLEHLKDYKQAVREAVRVSSDMIIIDLFHCLTPLSRDVTIYDKRGYFNNWYSHKKFKEFLRELPISGYGGQVTKGTAGQTAEIYVLNK